MPTTHVTERLCPECGSTLGSQARYCGCGWGRPRSRGTRTEQRAPDPEVVLAIARSNAAADARSDAPRMPIACQSRICPITSRCVPGRDLCKSCAMIEDEGREVPRIGRPKWARTAGDLVPEL